MEPTEISSNSLMGFRPAKHCAWIIWIVQLWNAIGLAWHNRLHLEARDLEILKNFPKASGLILAANHSDEMDPRVCMELSRRTHLRFTYMINSEAFEELHGLYGWLLQRLGDFSVERGGNDQAARRYTVDIIKKSSGALVMFPEGEISYLNDVVQPFKTGVVHIGLQAIAETRETNSSWTAYLVPVAIKYYYRKPIGLILDKKIRAIEKRLSLHTSFLTLQERIIRIMAKIVEPLGLKSEAPSPKQKYPSQSFIPGQKPRRFLQKGLNCQEPISHTQTISEQLAQLREQVGLAQAALISKIETKYSQLQIDPKVQPVDRAQKIIFFLRENLSRKGLLTSETRMQLQKEILDLKKSIQMAGWQPQYIDLNPSEERLAETVMKLEREVFKLKKPRLLGNRNAFVRIGPPLDLGRYVEQYKKDPSTISHQIAEELRYNIQLLIENMT